MKITELFERGEFVVSAEVGPPKGFHVEHLLEDAKKYLKAAGAKELFVTSSYEGTGFQEFLDYFDGES